MRIIFYIIHSIAFLCLAFTANAQRAKVENWYDEDKRSPRAVYHVLEDKPQVLDGKYTSFYRNGNVKKEGRYKQNKPVGKWTYYDAEGNISAVGELSDTVNDWKYFYPNGQLKTEGKVINGEKQGIWRSYHENGELKSKGTYHNGLKNGKWEYFYESGVQRAEAVYDNGTGTYKELYPNGAIKMRGTIVNGESEGNWTYFYPDGSLKARGYESNGVKHGQWEYFHRNGEVSSRGKYVQGKQHGEWEYFHPNGKLSSEGKHKEGMKDGHWKLYHRDGGFKAEGNFTNGTGEYKEYHDNGNLKVKGKMVNDKHEGIWEYYYEDGTLEGKCDFHQGKGIYKGYYKDGSLKMEGSIVDGQKTGMWVFYDREGEVEGYHKIVYDKQDGQLFDDKLVEKVDSLSSTGVSREPKEDSVGEKNTKPESVLPDYKHKSTPSWRKNIRYFNPKPKEYRGAIVSANPLSIVAGSLPVALEYYWQERLGYEAKYILLRRPFTFSGDKSNIEPGQRFSQGFSVSLQQKFYHRRKHYGMPYFGHQIRFVKEDHFVNDDSLTQVPKLLNADEQRIEYTLMTGVRYNTEPRAPGVTFEMYLGIGVGFRYLTIPYKEGSLYASHFQTLDQDKLFVPVRVGFNLGYVF